MEEISNGMVDHFHHDQLLKIQFLPNLPQVMGVGDSQISSPRCCRPNGIKQLLRDWHGIPIRFGLLINWTVMPAHLFLRPISKDILLRLHNHSTSIYSVGKFD